MTLGYNSNGSISVYVVEIIKIIIIDLYNARTRLTYSQALYIKLK